MKAFILVLLVSGADFSFYVMEPVATNTKEDCVSGGKRYADYKQEYVRGKKDSKVNLVSFISCHEGTIFSNERPDMRD